MGITMEDYIRTTLQEVASSCPETEGLGRYILWIVENLLN